MEFFTLELNRTATISEVSGFVSRFERKDVIDEYESLIWTERYYGDSDVESVLPLTMDMIEKLPQDIFLGINESNEIMVLDTITIEDGKLKIQGISLLKWLNNRFVRMTKSHKTRSWTYENTAPGWIVWQIFDDNNNPLKDSTSTDIPDEYMAMLPIPEIGVHYLDVTGDAVTVKVSYGPVYDEMRKVAETYKVGMQIILETNLDPTVEKPLGFRSYTGLNKTSTQDPFFPQNPIVRFSSDLESLGNVKEFQSSTKYRTIAFGFAPNVDIDMGDPDKGVNNAGIAIVPGTEALTGLDLRAMQVFAEDLSGYSEPISNSQLRKLMRLTSAAARKELSEATVVKAVEGEIVATGMFQFGRDYNLGDLVELQGSSGLTSIARVTEYIRVEDAMGERGYPTVTIVEDRNRVITPALDYPLPVNFNDNVGNAVELPGNLGSIGLTNIDCTTDGHSSDGNTDWLVHEFSSLGSFDTRNWHTMWFKWAVPIDDWVEGVSVFTAYLLNYDSHSVLFLCAPLMGSLPGAGDPPADPTTYQSLGGDSTGVVDKPYGMLVRIVDTNWWVNPTTYEHFIYIGIGSPPSGVLHNRHGDHGGRFTLAWEYKP